MKKVFLLALALCSTVVQTNATDMAANCTQQGFQIGVGFGYGLTTPTNKVYNFDGPTTTMRDVQESINTIIPPDGLEAETSYDFAALALDYSNVSSWQSGSAILASFNVGYKTFFDCNRYSVTGNAFIMLNSVSMTSNLMAELATFQAQLGDDGEGNPQTDLVGGVGSRMEYAGKLKLSSGAVFGFNVLLAKEFSWGNAGLLLGMKFNPYKLSYLQTKPVVPEDNGLVALPGFMDTTGETNDNTSISIKDYVYSSSKTITATGFTVGFSTNYYISDNVSAGLTFFYDMYTPITFNLNDISVSAYATEENNVLESGKIKFQNNTMGVMMNLTYSFGAN
jgi:hypothetical protein